MEPDATPRLFADDMSITVAGKSFNEIEVKLNHDLVSIKKWLAANKLSLNIAKTEYLVIGFKARINALPEEPCLSLIQIKLISAVENEGFGISEMVY